MPWCFRARLGVGPRLLLSPKTNFHGSKRLRLCTTWPSMLPTFILQDVTDFRSPHGRFARRSHRSHVSGADPVKQCRAGQDGVCTPASRNSILPRNATTDAAPGQGRPSQAKAWQGTARLTGDPVLHVAQVDCGNQMLSVRSQRWGPCLLAMALQLFVHFTTTRDVNLLLRLLSQTRRVTSRPLFNRTFPCTLGVRWTNRPRLQPLVELSWILDKSIALLGKVLHPGLKRRTISYTTSSRIRTI